VNPELRLSSKIPKLKPLLGFQWPLKRRISIQVLLAAPSVATIDRLMKIANRETKSDSDCALLDNRDRNPKAIHLGSNRAARGEMRSGEREPGDEERERERGGGEGVVP
jgi:hypothetical protein